MSDEKNIDMVHPLFPPKKLDPPIRQLVGVSMKRRGRWWKSWLPFLGSVLLLQQIHTASPLVVGCTAFPPLVVDALDESADPLFTTRGTQTPSCYSLQNRGAYVAALPSNLPVIGSDPMA